MKHQRTWLSENTKHMDRFTKWLRESGQRVFVSMTCEVCEASGAPDPRISMRIDKKGATPVMVLECACTERRIRR